MFFVEFDTLYCAHRSSLKAEHRHYAVYKCAIYNIHGGNMDKKKIGHSGANSVLNIRKFIALPPLSQNDWSCPRK